MKKYLILLFTISTLCAVSNAGLITHNDYTAGSVITAAGQNANENTIVNEFNGNIDNTNIKTGGVNSTNILDGTIQLIDLNAALQSTFTVVTQMLSYHRPVLVWDSQINNSTGVYVSNNTGTANQTCVLFPNELRCVTETINASAIKRRAKTSVTADNNASPKSGMAPGETVANNTWYAVYAWKVSSNATDFVLAFTTNVPTQTNYAQLNTVFGTGAWQYIGTILNGDGYNNADSILKFVQNGNLTIFNNIAGGSNDSSNHGALLTNTGAALSLTWTYGSGTNFPNIPSNLAMGSVICSAGSSSNILKISNASTLANYFVFAQSSGGHAVVPIVFSEGITMTTLTANEAMDIHLYSYFDSALGYGNSQL